MIELGLTLSEKILAHASGSKTVVPGDIVDARIDIAMTHDSLGILAVQAFTKLPIKNVWNPDKIVIVFDHKVPAPSISAAESQSVIRQFAKQQRIKNFYDVGRGGICHQVLHEMGHVKPGEVIVGTDSHTTTHGALGAFAVGIGSTEMAGVFSTGQLWFKVPETIAFHLLGEQQQCVMGKDIILHMIGMLRADGANYKAVEFMGPAIDRMNVSDRLSICNMSAEMGAKNAIIEPDAATVDYLKTRVRGPIPSIKRDPDVTYAKEYEVQCNDIEPLVAAPFSPDNVRPVTEIQGVEIDQAFLGSCTNGRVEDLRAAARILKGHKIKDSVRLVIIPASQKVWTQAEKEGLLDIFIKAGASVCTPSCGPCTGADKGILGPNERCIATTNRNFVGRMGHPTSEIYLANPYTVAASAIAGEIIDPRPLLGGTKR